MTDADALLAHALAHPDDHTAKLAWLDAHQEQHGETPWVQATREFLAKCGERRKYEKVGYLDPEGAKSFGFKQRRALPGWREWLGGDESWQDMRSRHNQSWIKAGLLSDNWWRLCPSLNKLITREASWRRESATVELWLRPSPQPPHYERIERSARLTFARGFLERVECRDWQSADAMLPAFLADQPFAECGIRGQPLSDSQIAALGSQWRYYEQNAHLHVTGYAVVLRRECGPAFDCIEDFTHRNTEAKFFCCHDALARARRALSNALRKRALAGAALEAAI